MKPHAITISVLLVLSSSALMFNSPCAAQERQRNEYSRRRGEFVRAPGKFWLGAGSMKKRAVTVDGSQRVFHLYTPPGRIRRPAPLFIAFHGGGGTAWGTDKLAGGITKLADREGFLVAFPEGLERSWNDGRAFRRSEADDVLFITKMIDRLVSEVIADKRRIYAAGISNGGFLSQYLALKIPERLAAVASVAATVTESHLALKSGKPVPILFLLGTDDPLIPWKGGEIGGDLLFKSRGQVVAAQEGIKFWIENNGTSKRAEKKKLPDLDPKDGMRITVETYSKGNPRSDVVVYEIEGGGHTWPGGSQYLPVQLVGPTNREMDGNQVIWNFFKRHKLP